MGGAGITGIFFPRKTEGSDSELLSHEKMAQVILDHPHNVCLGGDTNHFGRVRNFSDKEWRVGDSTIVCNQKWSDGGEQVRSVAGCMIKVIHTKPRYEEQYDISDPKLKVIHCVGHSEWSNRTSIFAPTRHFCRIGQQWREL